MDRFIIPRVKIKTGFPGQALSGPYFREKVRIDVKDRKENPWQVKRQPKHDRVLQKNLSQDLFLLFFPDFFNS